MGQEDVDQRLAELRERAQSGGETERSLLVRGRDAFRQRFGRRRRGDTWLIAAGALIGVVLLIAAAVLAVDALSGDGNPPAENVSAASTTRAPTSPRETATPQPSHTELPFIGTAQPPARQDCDAIRGTSYQSEEERAYFQENCLEPGEDAPAGRTPTRVVQAPAPTSPQVPPPPAATPTTAPPNAAALAVARAVDWIDGNGTYEVSAASCGAVLVGDHWVVTCSARVSGCQGSVCNTSVSVCVEADLSSVRPSDRC